MDYYESKTAESKIDDLVTIIVPIYNVEKYLKRCLDSITTQTYKNLEIILINDGSSDNSLKIATEYARSDKRYKLITQSNQGLSAARNLGIDHATGKWIMFIDSDDYLNDISVETLICAAKMKEADLVIGSVRLVDENEQEIKKWINKQYLSPGGVDCFPKTDYRFPVLDVIACNKLFNKDIFSDIRYPFGKMHEDEYLVLEIFERTKKVYWISNIIYNYRIRSGSIMSTYLPKKDMDRLKCFRDRILYLDSLGIDQTKTKIIEYFYDYDRSVRKMTEIKCNKSNIVEISTYAWNLLPILLRDKTVGIKEKIWHLLFILKNKICI